MHFIRVWHTRALENFAGPSRSVHPLALGGRSGLDHLTLNPALCQLLRHRLDPAERENLLSRWRKAMGEYVRFLDKEGRISPSVCTSSGASTKPGGRFARPSNATSSSAMPPRRGSHGASSPTSSPTRET